MRPLILVALFLSSLAGNSFAQKKTDQPKSSQTQSGVSAASVDSSARLPIKRVVLYKNGVGYFEHTARIHGTQDLSIDFTTAQLNDVLKSLTAVDLGDGSVSSVRYNSIAPLDERLRSLRLPFGEQVTQAEYLAALRGARVEVRSVKYPSGRAHIAFFSLRSLVRSRSCRDGRLSTTPLARTGKMYNSLWLLAPLSRSFRIFRNPSMPGVRSSRCQSR